MTITVKEQKDLQGSDQGLPLGAGEGLSINERWQRFKAVLNETHHWPEVYTFRFIVKSEHLNELKAHFASHWPQKEGLSKGGKYTKFSIQIMVPNAEEVIRVYQEAGKVESVICI